MSKVFVVDTNKQPLSPVHPARARKLLAASKAAVYRRYPFAIILKVAISDPVVNDNPQLIWNKRAELVQRLLAQTCELCGLRVRVDVHHIRALKDLEKPGRAERPKWVKIMAARRRKTLIVCENCHNAIHGGRVDGSHLTK